MGSLEFGAGAFLLVGIVSMIFGSGPLAPVGDWYAQMLTPFFDVLNTSGF